MPYRSYPAPLPLSDFRELIVELPADHLARLVEQVVEEFVVPAPRPPGKGNPPYDPRLCAKVLIYGYATGTRSSRQLERLCQENIAYLFLTRGDTPPTTPSATSATTRERWWSKRGWASSRWRNGWG